MNNDNLFFPAEESFTPVTGKRGFKNINTHVTAIQCLTNHLLNELLVRFYKGQIVRDINLLRNKNNKIDKQINIESTIDINNKTNNTSLYLNFIKNNIQRFHFSFHLCPVSLTYKNDGLIHIKENNVNKTRKTNTKYNKANVRRLTVTQQPNSDLPFFSLSKSFRERNIDIAYQEESQIICAIFNKYFDIKDPLYLGKSKSPPYPQLEVIKKHMNTALQTHGLTRKGGRRQRQ